MKSAQILQATLEEKYKQLLQYDKREIDNPDLHDNVRVNYWNRLNLIISTVQKYFKNPGNVQIGDFACAQGNASLLLAELGYIVFAIDINESFISYAKHKYEKGQITWIVSNIEELDLPKESLDMAIAGELVEHCAHPDEILSKIMSFLRPGGLLIITTPNGSSLKNNRPTFSQFSKKSSRKSLENRQFGPDGEDHLFLFTAEELPMIVPQNSVIIESGYDGGTFLINKYSRHFFKLLPIAYMEQSVRFLSRVPLVNQWTYHNIYAVIQKQFSE
ncbi:MAG: methyltransferase domain-containing protein [SAR324 cluster bacterium]|nr:methyltransferase domain-containing protein [SAR324 cluster bacterium]